MENDLKGNENYFELTGGSSYGVMKFFSLPRVGTTSSSPVKLEQENQEWLMQFQTTVNSLICEYL